MILIARKFIEARNINKLVPSDAAIPDNDIGIGYFWWYQISIGMV